MLEGGENISARLCEAFCDNNSKPNKYVMGRNEQARLIASHFEVSGCIDDFTEQAEFMGVPIVKTGDISEDSIVVVCSTMRPLSAMRMLHAHGIHAVVYYVDLFRWLNQPPFGLEVFRQYKAAYEEHRGAFEWIYSLLSDDVSRQTFTDLVSFRSNGDLKYMQAYSFDPVKQYFEDFVEYKEDEVFVDAGGYDGQTAREFIRHCPDYKRIYFFEPSEENMRGARETLGSYPDIEYIAKGLSNEQGVVRFDPAAGSASSISPEGSAEIKVDSLDNLVRDRVTFIKMDIEGAEALAIEGCRGHILKDHPKMAIAIYHKDDDFWDLPKRVLSIRNDYDIYIRHYTEGTDETIMYFMPQ